MCDVADEFSQNELITVERRPAFESWHQRTFFKHLKIAADFQVCVFGSKDFGASSPLARIITRPPPPRPLFCYWMLFLKYRGQRKPPLVWKKSRILLRIGYVVLELREYHFLGKKTKKATFCQILMRWKEKKKGGGGGAATQRQRYRPSKQEAFTNDLQG